MLWISVHNTAMQYKDKNWERVVALINVMRKWVCVNMIWHRQLPVRFWSLLHQRLYILRWLWLCDKVGFVSLPIWCDEFCVWRGRQLLFDAGVFCPGREEAWIAAIGISVSNNESVPVNLTGWKYLRFCFSELWEVIVQNPTPYSWPLTPYS